MCMRVWVWVTACRWALVGVGGGWLEWLSRKGEALLGTFKLPNEVGVQYLIGALTGNT